MSAIVNGKNYKHICNIKRSGHRTVYTIAYGGDSLDLVHDKADDIFYHETFLGFVVYFESFDAAYNQIVDYLMVDAVEDTLL